MANNVPTRGRTVQEGYARIAFESPEHNTRQLQTKGNKKRSLELGRLCTCHGREFLSVALCCTPSGKQRVWRLDPYFIPNRLPRAAGLGGSRGGYSIRRQVSFASRP